MDHIDKKIADKGAWISIIAYISLSLFKLVIGYIANSKALSADGLNNSTDILASVAILIGLRLSRKPPDHNHPYGHKRAETVASLTASFIMLVVGIQVIYHAIVSFIQNKFQSPDLIAAYTSIFCSIIMYFVYRYNKNLAIKVNSHALMAAAKDNLSDAWVSVGAAVAILATQFQLSWLDPLAAVVVGVLICKTAWDIFADAAHMLTDGIDTTHLYRLEELTKQVNGVNQVKDVKARVHGSSLLVDVTISVNPSLTVQESHTITEIIEEKVKDEFPVAHIHVHVEPLI